MPRRARVHVPGGFYHVTLRGNHRQAIFRNDSDRELLTALTSETMRRYDARLHAYCWMTNHIHLLPEVGDVPLGRMMQTLASRYARMFQSGLQTTGHLFERRYHAVLIEDDSQMLQTIRYIHLNPLTAGLVSDPGGYRWSSHGAYCGSRGVPWLTTARALAIFDSDPSRARRAYDRFIRGEADQDEVPAEEGIDPQLDGRESVAAGVVASPPSAIRSWTSLDEIITVTCKNAGVMPDVLATRSGSHAVSELRAQIAMEAIRSGLATLSQLAARFGCSSAAVSRLLQRRATALNKRFNSGTLL